MRNLVLATLFCVALFGVEFVMDILKIPAEQKFILAIGVTIAFVVVILRLIKKMSRLENSIFTVIVIATLTTSWALRDVKEGKISTPTLLAFFALVWYLVFLLFSIRERGKNGGDR